ATVNPASGAVLTQVAECGPEDVDRAVAAARTAFDSGVWSRCAPTARKAVLKRLAALISDNAVELALLDSLDGGKRIVDTSSIDVPGSAAILEWYAEAVDKVYGEVAPTGPGDLAIVTREPLGVVAAVVPWNYPLEMAIWKVAPALAAGNSVVLKPAEQSPLSALRLGELAAEAGLPDGVLNVVPGAGPVVGRALGEHPGVDVVAFTGSTEVGKLFLGYAARSRMKQVWLECGGKSANVVFADAADLDAVADGVCFGIFANSGQVCSANSRLLVEASVKDELLAKVVARAGAIRPGDPLDPATSMGPLVSEEHAARVVGMIDEARSRANLVLGGGVAAGAPTGTYVEPTIFDEVPWDAPLSIEEVFGPVLAVFTFTEEEEAITRANASEYGLAASVWTDSHRRAHRVASRLRAGTVSVNTVDALDVSTPFGGFGESGFGRDLSLHALDKFTGLKTTWFKVGS
ncbi:MAG: aldehyde dehydrogenase, partial [Nocardioides sp.]